jgi:hypothetical protein
MYAGFIVPPLKRGVQVSAMAVVYYALSYLNAHVTV